jgi:hypothetical protein
MASVPYRGGIGAHARSVGGIGSRSEGARCRCRRSQERPPPYPVASRLARVRRRLVPYGTSSLVQPRSFTRPGFGVRVDSHGHGLAEKNVRTRMVSGCGPA